ncbi:MAG: hypothetical protein ACUVQG_09870 [Thermogutta sp.]
MAEMLLVAPFVVGLFPVAPFVFLPSMGAGRIGAVARLSIATFAIARFAFSPVTGASTRPTPPELLCSFKTRFKPWPRRWARGLRQFAIGDGGGARQKPVFLQRQCWITAQTGSRKMR